MKITDTHVYFYSSKTIYSNWHRCKYTDPVANAVFNNSEQGFMWHKANFFGDIVTRDKILHQTDAKEVKALGREIHPYIESAWDSVRLGMMVWTNLLKFEQNESFKQELLSTGNKILVEASPYDRVWGVGLSEDDSRILDKSTWNGLNLLGEALMIVRSKL